MNIMSYHLHCTLFVENMYVFGVLLTNIISDEIRVVFLDAVVQYSHNYTSSCVALSPGFFGIQVLMHWVGLQDTHEFSSPANLL